MIVRRWAMGGMITGAFLVAAPVGAEPPAVVPPAALTLDRVPPVPTALKAATSAYLDYRTAAVEGWNPVTRGLLIATPFGNSTQLHAVAMPGAERTQLSFEDEPVTTGS